MSMNVRRAGVDDLDALAVLFDAYRQFYAQPSDVPGAQAFLEARLVNDESVIFIAEVPEGAAGFTQLYPLFTSVGMQRLWLLNDLYVAAGQRRTGAATALMEAAHAHAIETGASGVMLETQKTNAAAQALYRRLGYRRNDVTDFWFLALPQ
ncbi:MAG TPA: GNAT family N-acetyltransferase [Gammaproteobacteria bacterium]